jgi:integrase
VSRPKKTVPSYRLHKQSGQAIVTVNQNGRRKDLLLGRFNSEESLAEYGRVIAEYKVGGVSAADTCRPSDLTVAELLEAFWEWADSYYKAPAGEKPHRGGTSPRYALRSLRELYGPTLAAEFGPKALQDLRQTLVDEGLSRNVVNGRTGAVKRLFKWAVSQELVSAEVYHRLATVEGLRAGQTDAPDRQPVRPAKWADVETALPFMPAPVQALVLLQVHSGARAGELVRLTAGAIDRTDPAAWAYSPATHKGTWKGKARVVYFGKKCQEVLAPFLLRAGGPDEFLFSPARAEADRNADRSADRKTPRWPSHMKRNAAKKVGKGRMRPPRERYTTDTYRRAVERACEAARVPVFTPHRLRHLAATRTWEALGVDVARALLGHSLAAVTEIYSHEVDRQLALKAVEKFG